MFFHVDESGHTGTNLFDENQPVLYYGVLSSPLNIDKLGFKFIPKLRKKVDADRLHASELGNGRLVTILPELLTIQKKFKFKFDIFQVKKPDHAVISFFDQVFDQGLNPAVPWTSYWTPLRYPLLLKLSLLFDIDLLKKAWGTRIEKNNEKAESELVAICAELRSRVHLLPDKRSQQIITDTLLWAERNPKKIDYNISSKDELLSISPNLVGFQFVMSNIGFRLQENKAKNSSIIVDQQSQFNKSQKSLAEFYARAKESCPISEMGPGMPDIDFTSMPSIPIQFKSGHDSYGLELVDIYLWIFKRFMEKKTLAPELYKIIKYQSKHTITNEISLKALDEKWSKWFKELPDISKEEDEMVQKQLKLSEQKRHELMSASD